MRKRKGMTIFEAFLEKLGFLAENGFASYEGERNELVRHETGRAYRVRFDRESLVRLIGFYEDDRKRSFVALAAIYKHRGDDYTPSQWETIKHVDSIAQRGLWRKE